MATKRTGLGRGIGALIPTSDERSRPVDVFFPDSIGAGAPSGVQGDAQGKGEPELVAVPRSAFGQPRSRGHHPERAAAAH